MPSPQPDVPVVKATTGKFAVFQRMRLKMSLLHLPSICYLTVSERPQVFAESGLAPFEKCTVYIGDTLAATMYAVAVEPHVDKAGHQVSLAFSGAVRWLGARPGSARGTSRHAIRYHTHRLFDYV
jgi:hypothetical protein